MCSVHVWSAPSARSFRWLQGGRGGLESTKNEPSPNPVSLRLARTATVPREAVVPRKAAVTSFEVLHLASALTHERK